MSEDSTLLQKYMREGSERAFAEFVERHLPLVYHTALRQANGNTSLADEATQNVFTAVASKAASLSNRPILTGWLYTSTRLETADLLRREQRRLEREHRAFSMQQIDQCAPSPDWVRIAPLICEVLGELGELDRSAILLRFFEDKKFAHIGRVLRVSEDGARRRVARALDKLNGLLSRRGIRSTSALVASALATQQVGAAPMGLTVKISATALAGAAGTAGWGSAFQWLSMNKLKSGTMGALMTVGLVVVTLEVRENRALRVEQTNLQNVPVKEWLLPAAGPGKTDSEAIELNRLRLRSDQLQARPSGVIDAAMKPVSSCQNRGNATTEEAIETLFWAAKCGNLDAFVKLCHFDEKWRPMLDSWFATLGENVRIKYGNPQRLLASKWAGLLLTHESSGQVEPDGPVINSYQLVDQQDSLNEQTIEYWAACSGGLQKNWEASGLVRLVHDGGGWRYIAESPSIKTLGNFDQETAGWMPQLPLFRRP